MTTLIVLFGAAVRAGGTPSPTLARRIDAARAAALATPDARILCSGAVGREGPSEASVMARYLSPDIAADRLILDEDSRDTLQTARVAAQLVRSEGIARCLVCTDRFHQPRARMLLRVFGIRADRVPMRHGSHWRPVLREVAAYPYDVVAGMWARVRRR